ncbi:unnamed protein product [Pylaiella littoralis]
MRPTHRRRGSGSGSIGVRSVSREKYTVASVLDGGDGEALAALVKRSSENQLVAKSEKVVGQSVGSGGGGGGGGTTKSKSKSKRGHVRNNPSSGSQSRWPFGSSR